ncbi:NfeD family protein [Geoalkalibacter halelectricus]|uniref:Nodulation protein NfeD n=1 Tax=Geoalkalibacter halelectricus TaxID=2847045 RepID=A0ABY5ZKK1_9BACT|nr:nodulation protein NfeD [Geoalkalibacter halelectricus]MDO3376831.1 nodulation protein NfeD [Geoalkalibacter halelectricus]UWZ79103.1 nodulation protein NfeD [Geoalkalibacter halelectricus]
MKRFQRLIPFLLIISLAVSMLVSQGLSSQTPTAATARINVVQVADVINPVVARFIKDEIERTNREGMHAFLLELDTPGGLDTAMRDIIQSILNSQAPVIVYVAPRGARAASAGALITLAADFAAMAPGTNIGAATPVALGGGEQDDAMMEKVLQDAVAYAKSLAEQRGRNKEWAERIIREGLSSSAREALELQVIDIIADDRDDLFAQLDGRRYLRAGQSMTLATAQVDLVFSEMNWRQQILTAISNPNVAYLLLMLGFLGIFFELSNPGAIVPGAIGAIALLLAFFGLQTLPVNYVGVLLLFLAVVLFMLEIYVSSYGMLTVGGILSMALGSLMLIDTAEPYMQISRAVIFATVLVCAGFFIVVIYFVTRTQRRPAFSGTEGMVGERGRADSPIAPEGRVFVHGELWTAVSSEHIAEGEPIEVVGMLPGMKLEVRRIKSER